VKKSGILILFLILLLAAGLWADDISETKLFSGYWVQWQDAEDNYATADSAGFDGVGVDDMGISSGVAYAGTVDTVVVVEIIDTSAATADTIAWGLAAGTDTASIALTDTVVIEIDSTAIITGQLYAIFDDSTGHTIGDRWVIQCYGEDRDTIWSTSTRPVRLEKTHIRVRTRVWADAAATDDTIIHSLYNSFTKDSASFFLAGGPDTITGATINDTAVTYLLHGSTADSTYGKYWKQVIYLCGQEADTIGYNIDSYIQGW